MITELSFQNFKSWRDTGPIRLAPISAFFGANSSGKSSILQLLLMLKQTAESADRKQTLELGDERSLVDLGTFGDILFGRDLSKPLSWNLTWKPPHELKVENPEDPSDTLIQAEEMGFESTVAWSNKGVNGHGRVKVQEMVYDAGGMQFGMRYDAAKSEDYVLLQPKAGTFRFIRSQGRKWPLPSPAKCYGFPDQVRAYYQNAGFLAHLELQFEELFGRIFYLGPLRDYPKRQYSWAGSQPTDMGRRGERVVEAILASRDLGVKLQLGKGKKKQTVEERVAYWLKEIGLISSFRIKPITKTGKLFQVWVRRHAESPEVLLTDVGFGVSQILPVLTLCYYAPKGSILILEQPEIHLHPNVQAGLADVLIDAIKLRDVQVIVESHSEHLLRRLQRRVAEEILSIDDVALYFCDTQDGASVLSPLELDLYGNITNWPQDFFGDQFGEITAMSEAGLQRKIRDSA